MRGAGAGTHELSGHQDRGSRRHVSRRVGPDPYRWLEDDTSAETAAWVEAQNTVTFAHLETIPFRAALTARLEQLYNYPKFGEPFRRGATYFFFKNDGLQNQSVIYRQTGLDGAPEVLFDPNTLSPDGTTKLSVFSVSKDGKPRRLRPERRRLRLADLRVLDVTTKQPLADSVAWVKVSGAAWAGDGFFYSRYPVPEKGKELSTKNVNHQVFFHRLGTPQSSDELVFSDPANPERFHTVETTEDERFLVLPSRTAAKARRATPSTTATCGRGQDFHPIVAEIGDDTFNVIDNVGDRFLVHTDRKAPNGRVFLFDPKTPAESAWKDVLPERPEPLDGVATGGGKLFASYLKDVTSRAYVFDLTGKQEHEIALPGPGAISGLGGRDDDKEVFYTFTSFNYPPTIFKYDVATRTSSAFRERDDSRVRRQRLRGDRRSSSPARTAPGCRCSSPTRRAWRRRRQPDADLRLRRLQRHDVPGLQRAAASRCSSRAWSTPSANLRGGDEYGEAWHEAGTKLQKQNVFDDFIAAAEWLIANKYTSPREAGDDRRLQRRAAGRRGA